MPRTASRQPCIVGSTQRGPSCTQTAQSRRPWQSSFPEPDWDRARSCVPEACVRLCCGERFCCPVLRPSTAIEAGTERREDIDHVWHEVVLHLGLVHNNQLAPTGCERRLDGLRTESSQPIAVLDNDGLYGGVRQQAHDLRPVTIQTGPNL